MLLKVKTEEDIKMVTILAKEIWQEVYQEILSSAQIEYMLSEFFSCEKIKENINNNLNYYFITEEEKQVGFLAYINKEVIELSKIYILKEFRNKGYASKIINYLADYKKNINLYVNKNNLKAIEAYEKMGFKIIKEIVRPLGNGFYADDYLMRKTPNFLEIITIERNKPYFQELLKKIAKEKTKNSVYPSEENLFKALELTPYENVKVVLIGQDPYHNKDQAMGLSFSVNKGIKLPPSLVNIFKELKEEFGYDIPQNGDLTNWALQGVLLINSVLTVSEKKPLSHQDFGWQKFTDEIIKSLQSKDFIVYILLGKHAQEYQKLITNKNHLILSAAHPSPFSCYRGFFGSNIFKKTNEALIKKGLNPINWQN